MLRASIVNNLDIIGVEHYSKLADFFFMVNLDINYLWVTDYTGDFLIIHWMINEFDFADVQGPRKHQTRHGKSLAVRWYNLIIFGPPGARTKTMLAKRLPSNPTTHLHLWKLWRR